VLRGLDVAVCGAGRRVVRGERNELRVLGLGRMGDRMRSAGLADMRNVYDSQPAVDAGFAAYDSIGRAGFSPDA